jgi:hypothetical protein
VFQTEDPQDKKKLVLKKILVMFSTYIMSTFFEDRPVDGDKVSSYAIDKSDDILIVTYKNRKLKAIGAVRFKFHCLSTNKTLYKLDVSDPDIMGRIKLGLFNLINGHMYFQNKVIKIRYDLLRTEQTTKLTES